MAVALGRLLLVVEALSTSPPGHYALTAALISGQADNLVKTLFTALSPAGMMITAGWKQGVEARNSKIKK